MPPTRRTRKSPSSRRTWSADTELVGITFTLTSTENAKLYPQYAIGLHAWFLDCVRQGDPNLSAYLHDGQSDKPFTVSELDGPMVGAKQLQLVAGETYQWTITALSPVLVQWLHEWMKNLPDRVTLRNAPLAIKSCRVSHPATTYDRLWNDGTEKSLALHFTSPTSFRRKGHHLPLPWPTNVFHSYLRRWNHFSSRPFDQEEFLAWVDEGTIIRRHQLESVKVAAGKKGSVTGFVGTIEYGLSKEARSHPQFEQLFFALGRLAPYCGTGHKTTFGLGQTRLGWSLEREDRPEIIPVQEQLARRIEQLTEQLMARQKRTGGQRAIQVCQTRATILARREFGESLQEIAEDLEMRYDTVKTYAKLARRALRVD